MKILKIDKKEAALMIDILNGRNYFTDQERKKIKTIQKRLVKITKTIKVSSAKGKGRALQQRVAQNISDTINIPYLRGKDESLIKSREMGQSGVDVVLLGEAAKRFPFSIECKNVESFNIRQTVEQAKNNMKLDTDWMVILKNSSFFTPVVIMDWDRFMEIYKGVIDGNPPGIC